MVFFIYDDVPSWYILKSPELPNLASLLSANDNAVPTVVIPANIALPTPSMVPPTPATPNWTPDLNVANPTTSTLVTSS